MGSLGNWAENALLNHLLKGTSMSQPAHIYIAFSTTDPGESGSGITEPAGLSRLQCDSWTISGNAASNTNTVTTDAASQNCGHIAYIALFDASTSGNMLAYGELTDHKDINAGDKAEFAAGEIDITLD